MRNKKFFWPTFLVFLTSTTSLAQDLPYSTTVAPGIYRACNTSALAQGIRDASTRGIHSIAASELPQGCYLIEAGRVTVVRRSSPVIEEREVWGVTVNSRGDQTCGVIHNNAPARVPCQAGRIKIRYYNARATYLNGQTIQVVLEVPERNFVAEARAYLNGRAPNSVAESAPPPARRVSFGDDAFATPQGSFPGASGYNGGDAGVIQPGRAPQSLDMMEGI